MSAGRGDSKGRTKIIVSYHNFRETPGDLMNIYQNLCRSEADIVKIVTQANTITDNIRIYQLLRNAPKPTISFCMGEYGIVSRILYRRFGSYLTFASLRAGKESAPGQICIQELLNTYRILKQDKHTSIYGLIGNPVSHSIGPAIHNTLFREMDLNCIYVPFKVDNIADFIDTFKSLDVKGYSVTIPHKEAVIKHLDVLEPMAEKIGAVNTIVNREGELIGFNTDCNAAIRALESVVTPEEAVKGKKVTLIGAGGAARAIAFGLKERQASVTIINRNHERAQALAGEVGCLSMKYDYPRAFETNILINATPVGMFPHVNETPVAKDKLRSDMVVFDTIYNPLETRLMRDARSLGCKVVGGLSMFIYQAAAQFELWTNRQPSLELIEKIAIERLSQKGG
jgi:3-dehydroquinate dehydratase/shikimate dehydrogenase